MRLPSASPVISAGAVSRMRSGVGPSVQSDQAQARASTRTPERAEDGEKPPADAAHAGEDGREPGLLQRVGEKRRAEERRQRAARRDAGPRTRRRRAPGHPMPLGIVLAAGLASNCELRPGTDG